MPVSDYGLYQLFLFYFGYIGFLHFGVLGGAIVRFAGCTYEELHFTHIKTQCCILFVILFFLSGILYKINSVIQIFSQPYMVACFFAAAFAQHVVWYSISVLQMSNRIEDASKIQLAERISWGVLAVGIVCVGFISAEYLVFSYVITRVISMIYSLMFVSEVVMAPVMLNRTVWKEFYINFCMGFPITLSDICSLLVIGVIRFAISDVWDIVVFANVSLVLSIAFFFLTFISAMSVVLLPALKQLTKAMCDGLYDPLSRLLSVFLISSLLLYFPASSIIAVWLPQYRQGLLFLGILFPLFCVETKFNLLVVTYLKTLWKTNLIFAINFFITVVSIIGCYVTCYMYHELNGAVGLITVVLGLRYLLGEIILYKLLCLNKSYFLSVLTFISMICFFEIIICMDVMALAALVYMCGLGIYIFTMRKQIQISWHEIKSVLVKEAERD